MVSLANRIPSSVVPGKAAQERFLGRHSAVNMSKSSTGGSAGHWVLLTALQLGRSCGYWGRQLEALCCKTAQIRVPSSSRATRYCQPQCPAEPGTGAAVATEAPGPGGSHACCAHLPSEHIGARELRSGFPAFHFSVPLSTDTASLSAGKENIFKGPDPFKRAGKESKLGAQSQSIGNQHIYPSKNEIR